MSLPIRAALAAGAGIVGWLAFPPVGWWPLSVVSVAALVVALRGVRARAGALLGFAYGLAFFLPLLWWIQVLGVDALGWLGAACAAYLAAFGAAAAVVQRLRWWPLWVALLWVAAEFVRGSFPIGGFPWGRLAYAQAGSPLGHLAGYGSAALVSFAVALCGTLLAAAVTDRPATTTLRGLAPVGGVAVIVLGAAVLPPGWAPDGDDLRPAIAVPVAIIQGNVPGTGADALGRARTVTRNHLEATEEYAADVAAGRAPAAAYVIWPENSTDIDPFTDPATRATVEQAVHAVGVPILVGAILDGPGPDHRRTAGIVWDPTTGPGETYVKRHPVPFGEYIPFRSLLLPLVGRLDQVGRETYAGTEPGVLHINGSTVGDVICFEVAYDGIVRDVVDGGAQVIVVQTNNATYAGSAQLAQQFEISRLRAIEFGRTVLVASTNGISGVIAPDGTVLARSEPRTRAILTTTYAPTTARTIASRAGPWPERFLATAGLLVLFVAIGTAVQERRRRRAADASPAPAASSGAPGDQPDEPDDQPEDTEVRA